MKSLVLIVTLILGILLVPLAAEAQQAGKVPRIGVLSEFQPGPLDAAFRQALRELGYVEGQNLAIEWRHAEGKVERLAELASDLVRLNVDVIVAISNREAIAARQATSSTPIVMVVGLDPVSVGLIASLARPGGNVTGTTYNPPEVAGKILEVLKDTLPRVVRLALIYEPTYPGMRAYYQEFELAAQVLRVTVWPLEIQRPRDVEAAFDQIRKERPDALYVVTSAPVAAYRTQILDFAAKNRLPAVYTSRTWVDAAGLMSYAANLGDLVRRNAAYVDKILKGAKPADLPVEQPTKFELVINLKTAKALGLTIPQSILIRADEVIQ